MDISFFKKKRLESETEVSFESRLETMERGVALGAIGRFHGEAACSRYPLRDHGRKPAQCAGPDRGRYIEHLGGTTTTPTKYRTNAPGE